MKVLLIHQYFTTPEIGGPLRSYHLAKGMVQHGHEVTVVTAHNAKGYRHELIEGFSVHYLPVFYQNELGFFRRSWAFLKFFLLASRKVSRLGTFDLCYAISTPLTVGAIALRLHRKFSLPYFFEVGDLWPEAPIQMGVLRNRWAIRFWRNFEKKVYDKALKIVALSPPIAKAIKQTSPQAEVEVLPNMADCQHYQPFLKPAHSQRFKIIYFGAAGKANNLSYLLKVAAQSDDQLQFIIAAKGAELQRIKNEANGLNNVVFLNYQNSHQLKNTLKEVDAVYVSYASLPVLTTGSPHKFFEGLASGKLMILNFGGWLAKLVEANECGFHYNPEQPQMMLTQLEPYLQDHQRLLQAQKRARSLAEERFSKEIIIQRLADILSSPIRERVTESAAYTVTV